MTLVIVILGSVIGAPLPPDPRPDVRPIELPPPIFSSRDRKDDRDVAPPVYDPMGFGGFGSFRVFPPSAGTRGFITGSPMERVDWLWGGGGFGGGGFGRSR
jgi:hypothetical protein